MQTIGSAILWIETALQQAGIENARFEARLLLCHVLHVETQILIGYPEREIEPAQMDELDSLVQRRCKREPMSHILGEREFWSLPFKVTKDTLTPRPDSETLIEAVLNHIPDQDRPLRVLDMGVGTGCLLLTVLSEYKQASGLGIDISPKALEVAIENATRLGLAARSEFKLGNWAAGIDESFDLVLSNPPYIPKKDKETLAPEVKDFEPDTALFAGEDGLDDYRKLAQCLPNLLKNKAIAVVELGIGQLEDVSSLMVGAGLEVLDAPKDLGAIARCLVIRKKL
ncbi:Release factor glutamine methyltransferase [Candidatus Terasakiella magnetica]|uniref:Release factor glutamine methyltransferase n=1 Tax=Candidatus Terasakiella magnetica TaxID=1867952 RepID=A0A1C3RFR8_9PROT|nr:peptide chain release factor N(5)-glutamine methyltransferase [Candidatus Terasakiella magnetica]SCA56062.1 Release factor glutamine methyltransferase [Candidatus Terasakiella magnetica]